VDGILVVAVYAAAVATGSLAWNVYGTVVSRVRVDVTADIGASHSLSTGTGTALRVRVHNRSFQPVTVRRLGVRGVGATGPEFGHSSDDQPIGPGNTTSPTVISPRDKADFHFHLEDAPAIMTSSTLRGWLQRGCVIVATLDSGVKASSPPVRISSELRLQTIRQEDRLRC
jgi:hypothetical protein